MSDSELRDLERRWRESGVDDDELAWLQALVRRVPALTWEQYSRLGSLDPESAAGYLELQVQSGELELERVERAASVGEPGARALCARRAALQPTVGDSELRELTQDVGVYLPLLWLGRDLSGLARLGSAFLRRPDPIADCVRLLSGRGWREDLVGLIGLLTTGADGKALGALWRRAEASWVAPQCAVVAMLLDPDFRANARSRLSEPERSRDPKLLNALLQLYERSWPKDPVGPVGADRFAGDEDDGYQIASTWLERIEELRRLFP
ncbi:MAG: hypothetical protein AB7N76_05825 [Planctomycetota bacterium]